MQFRFNRFWLCIFYGPQLWAISSGTSRNQQLYNISNVNNPISPYVTCFLDLMVAQRTNSLNIQFQYGVPTDLVTPTVTGTGAYGIDGTGSMLQISTGTGTTGTAQVASIEPVRYIPGHEAYAYFTAMFTTGVASSSQWAGIFDSNNGFAVGYNAATFSILYRQGGSDTHVAQSAFNIDPLDGSGPSGIVLDPTKLNIYKISYGWLGTAPITFEICRSDGNWFVFHKIQLANTLTSPTVYDPVFPLTVQVTNSGNNTNLVLNSASWCGGVVGPGATYRQEYNAVEGITYTNPSSGPKFVFGLQNPTNNLVYTSKPNKIKINLAQLRITASNASGSSALAQLLRLTVYVGVANTLIGSGTSWTAQNSGISCAKYTTTGTTTLTGGTAIYLMPLVRQQTLTDYFVDRVDDGVCITLYPGQELALILSGTGSSEIDSDFSIIWHETLA